MKYVVILIAVVLLARIDVILKLFDKTSAKYEAPSDEVRSTEVLDSSEIVPVSNSFKSTPRKNFFNMLNDFSNVPDANFKDKAIEVLRSQPTMFSEKLDTELEAAIYRWRDLLVQKNKVTQEFLMEMMKSLKGENLEMVRRFFSFAIDIDLADFLNVYSKSTDGNCLAMAYLGDNLPEEEKYNELSERLIMLDAFLLSDKAGPVKPYAQRCQMILKLQIDKMKLVVAPTEDAVVIPETEATPEAPAVTTPVPAQVPAPAPVTAPAPSIDTGNSP